MNIKHIGIRISHLNAKRIISIIEMSTIIVCNFRVSNRHYTYIFPPAKN